MTGNTNSRRNSILIAAAVAIAFAAWILSGVPGGVPDSGSSADSAREASMRVSVRYSKARETTRTITVSARTEPDRAIELKAETEGRVVAVEAERGAVVSVGQNIAELDMRDRNSRLAETDALIRQRQLEFEAAEQLRGQQFMSPAELARREAELVSAQAARNRIALDIERTTIGAPFAGLVQDRLIEVGDYIAIGDPIAQLVDVDPLIVVGNVNERDIEALAVGDQGKASILGGPPVTGRIRYISPVADETTRSFRIELAVPNPDMQLRAGTSAELILGAETVEVHAVSPAVLALSLADDGTVGVKIVDDADRVRFLPVEIVQSAGDAVLVSGLPTEARIITVGQGFVVDGEAVVVEEEKTAALTQAQNERPY